MMRYIPFSRLRALVAVGALLAMLVVPAAVSAHAALETATPADGTTVEGSPPEISGVYSEAMDPAGSSLKLVDADDKELATGGVDPDDDTLMTIDPVPLLVPGVYTVESTTKSAEDGDVDRTTWSFTVVAAPSPSPTASPTPTPTPTPAASAAASPTPSVAPSDSPSPAPSTTPAPSPSASDGEATRDSGDVFLAILAAVVILAVIGALLFSRRDHPPVEP